MLGSNNSARFQSSTLSSIQTLQTSIATTRNNLQQQISVLNGQISTINTRLNDDSQLVGGKVTLASLGLQNVNNTADTLKPVSNATAAALDLKQNLLSLTNTLPVAHVTNLSTTLSDMNTLLLSKINSDALVFNNIKTSSTNSKSLTSTLSDINTSLNAKATTAALDLTNTQVGNKVNTVDLLFANVKESSQTGTRTLAAAISSIEGSLQTKANTNQLIYSQIKASTDANAETLTKTLSDMNTSIENKVNSQQLIFNNIKTSAADTTNLTTALVNKANKTDLTWDKITQSNASGSQTLENKLSLMDNSINAKTSLVPPVVYVTMSWTTITVPMENKNKFLVFTNAPVSPPTNPVTFITTTEVTIPDPTLSTNAVPNFVDGDFLHIICYATDLASGQVASPNNYTLTIKGAGPAGHTAFNINLVNAKANNEALTGARLQVMTINNQKKWVRVA